MAPAEPSNVVVVVVVVVGILVGVAVVVVVVLVLVVVVVILLLLLLFSFSFFVFFCRASTPNTHRISSFLYRVRLRCAMKTKSPSQHFTTNFLLQRVFSLCFFFAFLVLKCLLDTVLSSFSSRLALNI